MSLGPLLRVVLALAAAAFAGFPSFKVKAFSFDPKTGVSNRFLTPNGDGRNDSVVFKYRNPRDSAISGRIIDIKGAFVSELSPAGDQKLSWDGKGRGTVVPSGVYIYIIVGEDSVYTGTVVVVR